MVQQDVSQCCNLRVGVERVQINAGIGEGLVSWREDCERTVSLQSCNEICFVESGHEGVVYTGRRSIGRYVFVLIGDYDR